MTSARLLQELPLPPDPQVWVFSVLLEASQYQHDNLHNFWGVRLRANRIQMIECSAVPQKGADFRPFDIRASYIQGCLRMLHAEIFLGRQMPPALPIFDGCDPCGLAFLSGRGSKSCFLPLFLPCKKT